MIHKSFAHGRGFVRLVKRVLGHIGLVDVRTAFTVHSKPRLFVAQSLRASLMRPRAVSLMFEILLHDAHAPPNLAARRQQIWVSNPWAVDASRLFLPWLILDSGVL